VSGLESHVLETGVTKYEKNVFVWTLALGMRRVKVVVTDRNKSLFFNLSSTQILVDVGFLS